MLHIHFSNRYEVLRATLIEALAHRPASAFAAQQVIVPSSALRRDLTLAIAEAHGVCANVDFAFLAQWLWRQIGKVLPGVAAESPFAAPVLAWRLLQILDEAGFRARHPRLEGYLAQVDPVARFELAGQVAGLFEQYLTYRSDWLAAWAAGRLIDLPGADDAARHDQAWQADLWRVVLGQLGVAREHPAARFLGEVDRLGADAPERFGLPERAHVFCLPTLPPLYLDLLQRLGRWIDLRLYVLNPCQEYWFEIVDPRRLSYLHSRGEDALHETGNRLLAAWGRQTQAHIDLLLTQADGAGAEVQVDDAGFVPAPGGTLLASLQNAVLGLAELAPGSLSPLAGDRSIEVHVCHSLTRQLEVLHDQLLALFAGPCPPAPGDILVVTPDLDAAAPLIEAVFGNAPRARAIPYAVSGRGASGLSAPARALLDLLALADSRWSASAVFDCLQQPVVARRFGLDTSDLTAVRTWMGDAGVRWGRDGAHRLAMGLPEQDRFSFDDGLQRLWLGYALPDDLDQPWLARLPAGHAEGTGAQALGLFARFVAELGDLRETLAAPALPEAWLARLSGLLDGFLAPAPEEIEDLADVRAALGRLCDAMVRGGLAAPVDLDVVRAALATQLDDPTRGGVPTGAVTFSALASLRGLPFRVVCAVGLDDGVFPGEARPLEFDLMARAPRRGDRQRRDDERNLFLDLILAARERLYLSYTGRGIRDNAPLPASVLVAELLDTLAPALAADPLDPADREAARRRLLVEHPLQPFSLRYFQADADPRARSYNRELCEALRGQLRQAQAPARNGAAEQARAEAANEEGEEDEEDDKDLPNPDLPPFFAAPLPEPGPEWRAPSLSRLIRFFRHPGRFLLEERLGLTLVRPEDELADAEPFLPDFPGRQALGRRLLPGFLAGLEESGLKALARAGVEYPPGRFGERLLDQEMAHLRRYAQAVRQAQAGATLAPFQAELHFTLEGERWQLSGGFDDLRPEGLVRHRYDDARATDYLEAWLLHLFLGAAQPPGVDPVTRWIARDGGFALAPCNAPKAILADLMARYRQGLRAPLPCYPKSAWAYVQDGGGLGKARGKWHNRQHPEWSESADPAWRLALRGVADPLDGAFAACAEQVFGTLARHLAAAPA